MAREALKNLEPQLVERYRQALGDNLVALAFFGSWARGEEEEHSDIDVLLIARELSADPFERRWSVQEPILGLSQRPVSVLARTVEEFSADVSPLHLDLGLEALIFHDPEGFLDAKLQRVRELIEEAGLRREKMDGGFIWRWKDPPPPGRWAITWEGVRR